MIDQMPMPSVVTPYKKGKFTMLVFAYRHLSDAELLAQLRRLMLEKRWRSVPRSGVYKVISLIGFDDPQPPTIP